MAMGQREQSKLNKQIILNAVAKSFMEQGFTGTTIRQIISKLGISMGAFTGYFRTKEDVLYELVDFVLNQQFGMAEKLVAGKTDDKILLYAKDGKKFKINTHPSRGALVTKDTKGEAGDIVSRISKFPTEKFQDLVKAAKAAQNYYEHYKESKNKQKK